MGEVTKIARQLPTGQTEVFHVDFDAGKVHVETGHKHPATGAPLVRYVSENTEPFKHAVCTIVSPQGQVVGIYPQTKLSGPDHIKLIEPEEPTPAQDYLDELEALGMSLEPASVTSQGQPPVSQHIDESKQNFEEDDEFQQQFKKLVEEEKREEYGLPDSPASDDKEDGPASDSSGKKGKGK